jgi:hypothetical protein
LRGMAWQLWRSWGGRPTCPATMARVVTQAAVSFDSFTAVTSSPLVSLQDPGRVPGAKCPHPSRPSGLPVLSAQFPRTSSVCAPSCRGRYWRLFPAALMRTSRPALARVAALACCVRSGAARPPPRARSAAPGFKAAARVRAGALRVRQRPCSPAARSPAVCGRPVRLPLQPPPLLSVPCPGRRFPLPRPLRGFGAGRLRPRGQRRRKRRLFLLRPRGLLPRVLRPLRGASAPSLGFPPFAPGRAAARRC